MNTVLWNNPNNDGVWRAWVMAKDKANSIDFAVAFNDGKMTAYAVNDSYRIAILNDVDGQDEVYDLTKHQEREVFDLTEITNSRIGKKLIKEFKDHKFGQNPVNYGQFSLFEWNDSL